MTNHKALVCVDFINDIVSEFGKLSGKGYLSFITENQTLENLRKLQDSFREKGLPVFHVRVGFDPNYLNHPQNSPLFGAAKQFGALQLGTWGTEFPAGVAPAAGELIIHKPRVSAFYGTTLDSVLRANYITDVIFAGVATDLAVQAAARDAHDRDYRVTVAASCCAAANIEDHETALKLLSKVATISEETAL